MDTRECTDVAIEASDLTLVSGDLRAAVAAAGAMAFSGVFAVHRFARAR